MVGSPVGHAFGGFGRGAGTLSLTVISFSARQRSLILDEPCESDTAAGKRARIRQAERRSAVGGYACLCFASWSVSVWEGEPPTGSVSWPTPSRRSRAAADGSGLRISHHVPRSPPPRATSATVRAANRIHPSWSREKNAAPKHMSHQKPVLRSHSSNPSDTIDPLSRFRHSALFDGACPQRSLARRLRCVAIMQKSPLSALIEAARQSYSPSGHAEGRLSACAATVTPTTVVDSREFTFGIGRYPGRGHRLGFSWIPAARPLFPDSPWRGLMEDEKRNDDRGVKSKKTSSLLVAASRKAHA
ncbi:hypothetical protein SMICM17S_03734 [Streptomyces microflavus]